MQTPRTTPGHGPTPSDPPHQRLELPRGHAAYTDEGEGPVILLVHGLPGSGRDFRWLAPELTPFARVIRVDLPGSGETPVETEPDVSPAGKARFLVSVVRALGLSDVVAIGHSLGGVVVPAAVRLAPELFSAVGLLASPGLRKHQGLRRYPIPLIHRLRRFPLTRPVMRPLLRRSYQAAGFRRFTDDEVALTLECLVSLDFETHRENLGRLSHPTLVGWCEDDFIVEGEISAALADAVPEGPRLGFATGGHNLQKSHARVLGETIRDWAFEA